MHAIFSPPSSQIKSPSNLTQHVWLIDPRILTIYYLYGGSLFIYDPLNILVLETFVVFKSSSLINIYTHTHTLSIEVYKFRDEHGNPIQLVDQYGNSVQMTDEYGNPMHLTQSGPTAATGAGGFEPRRHEPPTQPRQQHEEIQRSSSSSSSSSEDDGRGGRRKKKGLKEKIKEKLTVGKHNDKDEAAHSSIPATTTPESKTSTSTPGQAPEHGKKGVIDKIKDMLPGH